MVRIYVAKSRASRLEFTGRECLSLKMAEEIRKGLNREAEVKKTGEKFVAINEPKDFGKQVVSIATNPELSEEEKERELDRLILQNGY